MPPLESSPDLSVVYEQLCESYRAIDDFRTKLLAALPLVTGGGLALLSGNLDSQFFLPLGVFGSVVTLGLFAFEIHGIGKCHALIEQGKVIEAAASPAVGQFQERPKQVLPFINEPFAAGIIYPSVMAAWAYVAALERKDWLPPALAAFVLLVGFAGTLVYDRQLKADSRHDQRAAATDSSETTGAGA